MTHIPVCAPPRADHPVVQQSFKASLAAFSACCLVVVKPARTTFLAAPTSGGKRSTHHSHIPVGRITSCATYSPQQSTVFTPPPLPVGIVRHLHVAYDAAAMLIRHSRQETRNSPHIVVTHLPPRLELSIYFLNQGIDGLLGRVFEQRQPACGEPARWRSSICLHYTGYCDNLGIFGSNCARR